MPYRGYRARRSLARSKPPTRREILAAVPPGSVRLRGRHAARRWLDALSGFCPELAGLYAPGRETHLEFARLLAGKVSWADGTTFHSRAGRCELAGRGETAWKVFRRHLETWGGGWLGTVRPGRIYYLPETGETRHDAAIYVICVPRSVIRKIAAWRRRRWPFLQSRPPTGEPSVNTSVPRAASSDLRERDGPPSGRAHPGGRPRNAELAAGGGPAGAMADALRKAAGQDLTDGWCGWFSRRYLAAGWTPAELAEALAGVPPRERWDYAVRTLPPHLALLFWLRRTPASHWALDWYAMKAGPARARARELKASQLEQRRQRAAAEAAAGRPAGIEAELDKARAAMRDASAVFRRRRS